MQPREIHDDTRVSVAIKGETGVYALAQPHALSGWCNTLSDLTGYTVDYVRELLTEGLRTQYGVILPTAAGELCPIRFLVTLESAAKEIGTPGQKPTSTR